MNKASSVERVWPSRVGLALAFFFWFLTTQFIPAFRPGADIEWNRGILQASIVFAAIAVAFALVAARRLGLLGRIGAVIAGLLSLYSIYLAAMRWNEL